MSQNYFYKAREKEGVKLIWKNIKRGLVRSKWTVGGRLAFWSDRAIWNGFALRNDMINSLNLNRLLYLILNRMNGGVDFIDNGIGTTRSWQDGVINDYLRQIQIWVNGCHLL